MERSPQLTAERIVDIAEAALGCRVESARHVPLGWGNENWRITSATGDRFVVKVGPPESAGKWSATTVAYRRAQRLGIPAPRLLHFDPACAGADGAVVRILSWVDGFAPEHILGDRATSDRFFAELGVALRSLHADVLPAFSSRLDGSAPSFPRWGDYVAHRMPQITARARAAGAFSDGELRSFADEIGDLATEVSPVVSPAMCHRDLHLGNLLAGADGGLVAVLDFDGAEAWDPAVDLVKLRWQVFGNYLGSDTAFARSYFADDRRPARWHDRMRLVDLLELVNTVANARSTGDETYEHLSRARLAALVA